ncbi:hypothetical protein K8R30_04155 [archaeon]|nr:hypothetical protein [archaeon]
MTILQKIQIGENAHVNIHEALYNLTTSAQKQKWIQKEKPCFDKKILEFWNLYCVPFSKTDEYTLSTGEEQDERRRFLRYPIITLEINSPEEQYITGGIWINGISINPKEKNKIASIHIKIQRKNRVLAYPLFEEFIKSSTKGYTHIHTGWGRREPEDDPTNFLQNWNFKIKKTLLGHQALLKLDDLQNQ